MTSDTSLAEVTTLPQAITIANIRNDCREFMTHDTNVITRNQQIEWFNKIYLPNYQNGHMIALLLTVEGRTVGFGLLSKRRGKWWITGGIRERYRGQGYGRKLFEGILLHGSWLHEINEIWLDVLVNNTTAIRLYESLGFLKVSADGSIIIMKRNYNQNEVHN